MEGSTFKFRAFKHGDEHRLVELLADKEIFLNTCRVPYPYSQRDAEEWVRYAMEQRSSGGNEHIFAIAQDEPEGELLIGCISLLRMDSQMELGYWLGKEYWGQGVITEAIGLAVKYGFEMIPADEIAAKVFTDNAASIKALEKNGFELKETLERHVNKAGTERDMHIYRKRRGE